MAGESVAVIWTLVMPTYCVTVRGIQLPWVTLSVRGPSASPPNSSIKRVAGRCPGGSCLPAQSSRHLAWAERGASMPSAFQLQCHLVLIFLAAYKGETRYLEVSNGADG